MTFFPAAFISKVLRGNNHKFNRKKIRLILRLNTRNDSACSMISSKNRDLQRKKCSIYTMSGKGQTIMQNIMLKQLSLDMGKTEYDMLQGIPAVETVLRIRHITCLMTSIKSGCE